MSVCRTSSSAREHAAARGDRGGRATCRAGPSPELVTVGVGETGRPRRRRRRPCRHPRADCRRPKVDQSRSRRRRQRTGHGPPDRHAGWADAAPRRSASPERRSATRQQAWRRISAPRPTAWSPRTRRRRPGDGGVDHCTGQRFPARNAGRRYPIWASTSGRDGSGGRPIGQRADRVERRSGRSCAAIPDDHPPPSSSRSRSSRPAAASVRTSSAEQLVSTVKSYGRTPVDVRRHVCPPAATDRPRRI